MLSLFSSARVYDKQVGGNTRYVRSIYPGLRAHGVDLTLLRPPFVGPTSATRSATYAIFESSVWPLSTRRKPDVLHFPADTGAVLRGRVPIVSTVHGLATMHVAAVRSGLSDKLWRARVSRMVSVSDMVVTVSESSARDIARFVSGSASKIRVVPHGIDHDKFNTSQSSNTSGTLKQAGVPESYFLYVGNLDPRKNLLALMAAASKVYGRTGVPLVVAGAPAWGSDEISAAAGATEGVLYIGRVPEDLLVPLMQGAVGFCFPSSYEGFGFPVLEAMACGTPVICSGRGSLDEVASGAALVIDDIGADSIESSMLSLLADESTRKELRQLGLARAAEYSWDRAIRSHAEVFMEAAS